MHHGGLTLKHVHQTKIQWDSTIYIYIYSNHQKQTKQQKNIHQQKKSSCQLSKKTITTTRTNLLNIPPITDRYFLVSPCHGEKVLGSSSIHKEHQEDTVHCHACPGKNLRWSLVSPVFFVSGWGGWRFEGRFLWMVRLGIPSLVQMCFLQWFLRGKRFF